MTTIDVERIFAQAFAPRTQPTRPTETFESYIGQRRIKDILRTHINYAKAKREPLGHVLLEATPGAGKTKMAHCIAGELGEPITVMDLSKVRSNRDLMAIAYEFDRGVLLLDEIHKATHGQQDDMLTILEEGYLYTPAGKFTFDHLTVVAATTEPEKLNEALKDRFHISPKWDAYTDEEMQAICRCFCPDVDVEMLPVLARAAAGSPRQARGLMQAYKAARHGGEPTLQRVLELAEVDPDGLHRDHYAVLAALLTLGGQAGETPLRSLTRMHAATLRHTERLLLTRGLIKSTAQGRVLTPAGRAKLRAG
jgi:Holliday junction DNA helicase RuvB